MCAGGGSGGGSGSELDNIDAELAAEAEPFDLDAAMEESEEEESEEEESEEEESEEEESEEEDEFEDEGELPQARPGHLDPVHAQQDGLPTSHLATWLNPSAPGR